MRGWRLNLDSDLPFPCCSVIVTLHATEYRLPIVQVMSCPLCCHCSRVCVLLAPADSDKPMPLRDPRPDAGKYIAAGTIASERSDAGSTHRRVNPAP